ncbi:MAG: large subunit ribosomal protein L22 [bacterium]|jgi:large subunit ribosomal protein L22
MKEPIAKASLSHVRIAPRKARLVIDQIRGMSVVNALGILENTRRRANPIIRDLLKSAIANATQKNAAVDPDELVITEARVDQGRTLKRMRPRAMGRGAVIRKHSSHILITIG